MAEATEMVGWAHLQLGNLMAARVNLSEAVDRYRDLGKPENIQRAERELNKGALLG